MAAYNFMDLTGQTFGKWTVGQRDLSRKSTHWWCRCKCGTERSVSAESLRRKASTGCRRCYEQGHKYNLNARLWNRILRNAKLRGIPMELGDRKLAKSFLYDLLYNQQKGLCALSGLPIVIANTVKGDMSRGETTASLDRIDSSEGYTKSNVQWVHKTINRMKLDLDQADFIRFCRMVSEYSVLPTA